MREKIDTLKKLLKETIMDMGFKFFVLFIFVPLLLIYGWICGVLLRIAIGMLIGYETKEMKWLIYGLIAGFISSIMAQSFQEGIRSRINFLKALLNHLSYFFISISVIVVWALIIIFFHIHI